MKITTGREIKIARLYLKKTHKQMADFFGIARSTYSGWESKYKNKLLPRQKYLSGFIMLEYQVRKKAEKQFTWWDVITDFMKGFIRWK